jgi:serine O-acetyltransferase
MNWKEFRKFIFEDLDHYNNNKSLLNKIAVILFSIPFQTIALYRLIKYCKSKPIFRSFAILLLYVQQKLSGCYIHYMADIGKNCNLPHPTGIVIGAGVHIGDRVTIYQHVTIGSHGKSGSAKSYPFIDDDVIIYAGAVIIGNVNVGEGATIGANAVVLKDVQAGWIVAGVPAVPLNQVSSIGRA